MDNTINQTIIEKVVIQKTAIYKAIAMLPPPEIKDLWEEKNLIDHKVNLTKKEEFVKENSITETKIDSTKNDWKDTTKKWTRNCPKCNKELVYKNKLSYDRSVLKNTNCHICRSESRITHEESLTNIIYLENKKCWYKKCKKCNQKIFYKNYRSFVDSINKNKACIKCVQLGKKSSEETKRKQRDSQLGKCKGFVRYNKNACTYFDLLNKQNDWKLQHALNGGEIKIIGYSLDAYDKQNNIVVEYDEPAHYDKLGNLKQKDVLRQQRIITHLGCKFFRYNERTKELYEVKTSMTS